MFLCGERKNVHSWTGEAHSEWDAAELLYVPLNWYRKAQGRKQNEYILSVIKSFKACVRCGKRVWITNESKKVEQNEIQYAILILHFQGFYGFYAVFYHFSTPNWYLITFGALYVVCKVFIEIFWGSIATNKRKMGNYSGKLLENVGI